LLPVYGGAPDIGPSYGGDAWALDVTFTADAHGVVSTTVSQIFPILNNPGNKTGDSYTFNDTVHGIAGYTLTIVLNNVEYPGPVGWTANVSCSPPPASPSTIYSDNAVKISSNNYAWTFDPDGVLTLPTVAGTRSQPPKSFVDAAVDTDLRLRAYGQGHASLRVISTDSNATRTLVDLSIDRVRISTNNDEGSPGDTQDWIFDANGNLTLPTNSGQSAIHSSGFITVGPTTPLEVMRIALDGHGVTIGGNSADNGLTYQRYSLGGTPIDSISTHRAGNLAEMRITADGESGGAIKLTSIGVDGYIALVSNSNEWHLGNTGDLTVPGDILGQEGNDLAVQVFNPDAQGGVSFVVQNRQVDLDNDRTTQFEVTPQDIKLTTDFSGNKNEWTFGADGTIQFPVLSILDLPSPVAGLKAFVNNADNFVPWGTDVSTLGHAGNNILPVWSDGYGWYVG